MSDLSDKMTSFANLVLGILQIDAIFSDLQETDLKRFPDLNDSGFPRDFCEVGLEFTPENFS